MTLRSLRLAPVVAILGLGLPFLSSAMAATPGSAPLPTLTSVQAQHVGKVDRVTFGFTNGLPADIHLQWVDTLHHDGSGLPVAGGRHEGVGGVLQRGQQPRRERLHDQGTDGVRAAQRDHRGQRR